MLKRLKIRASSSCPHSLHQTKLTNTITTFQPLDGIEITEINKEVPIYINTLIHYLGDFDLVLELVKAIIQPSEFVDILLVLPCHFRIGSPSLYEWDFRKSWSTEWIKTIETKKIIRRVWIKLGFLVTCCMLKTVISRQRKIYQIDRFRMQEPLAYFIRTTLVATVWVGQGVPLPLLSFEV